MATDRVPKGLVIHPTWMQLTWPWNIAVVFPCFDVLCFFFLARWWQRPKRPKPRNYDNLFSLVKPQNPKLKTERGVLALITLKLHGCIDHFAFIKTKFWLLLSISLSEWRFRFIPPHQNWIQSGWCDDFNFLWMLVYFQAFHKTSMKYKCDSLISLWWFMFL